MFTFASILGDIYQSCRLLWLQHISRNPTKVLLFSAGRNLLQLLGRGERSSQYVRHVEIMCWEVNFQVTVSSRKDVHFKTLQKAQTRTQSALMHSSVELIFGGAVDTRLAHSNQICRLSSFTTDRRLHTYSLTFLPLLFFITTRLNSAVAVKTEKFTVFHRVG